MLTWPTSSSSRKGRRTSRRGSPSWPGTSSPRSHRMPRLFENSMKLIDFEWWQKSGRPLRARWSEALLRMLLPRLELEQGRLLR
eukprot:5913290-Pyramimonas_sp.AAC.1